MFGKYLVRPLGFVMTSLPTGQEVLDSIPGSVVGLIISRELFQGFYRPDASVFQSPLSMLVLHCLSNVYFFLIYLFHFATRFKAYCFELVLRDAVLIRSPLGEELDLLRLLHITHKLAGLFSSSVCGQADVKLTVG